MYEVKKLDLDQIHQLQLANSEELPKISMIDLILNEQVMSAFIVDLNKSQSTIKTYTRCLKSFAQWLAMNGIQQTSESTVKLYMQWLENQGRQPSTIHLYIVVVKRWFKWLEAKRIYPDVAKNVENVRVRKDSPKSFFQAHQVKKILDTVDQTSEKGKRNYALLVLLFTCGLRTIEASRARVCNIRLNGSQLVLYIHGKGHKTDDDYVPLPDKTYAVLCEYLSTRGIKPKDFETCKEPLFTSTSNRSKDQSISTNAISKICKSCFRKAGYDQHDWTAHSTRHTAATLALTNGADLRETQMLLRHSSPTTTEIYIHQLGKLENQAGQDVANAIFD